MAVNPASQVNSIVNLGLPDAAPDDFKQQESISLYKLLVQSVTNLLTAIETYCGISQKSMTQWSLFKPSDTLRRQNLGRLYVIASETIGYGAFVNLYNNAGVLTARNSNSSTGKRAMGYCNVNNSQQIGMAAGQYGEVIINLGIIGIGGVAPGDLIYLAPTNGQVQIGPDTTVGHIEQYIGFGVATNLVSVNISGGTFIQH